MIAFATVTAAWMLITVGGPALGRQLQVAAVQSARGDARRLTAGRADG